MIKREGSIPVDEEAVAAALEILKLMPGGIEHVSVAVLTLLGRTMDPQDFAALQFEVEDAKRPRSDSRAPDMVRRKPL
jgi:hypothetical protein